ncbi:MAG: DUF2093 domain-containing protein [Ahrensia sp.]|nr:DUF2093 domain-containing protein [Ahrensia sp.]
MLNQLDPMRGQPAKLKYRESDFVVLVPGNHVVCAVTCKPIQLDDLKYWSFERQEPYVDAQASMEAETKAGTFG